MTHPRILAAAGLCLALVVSACTGVENGAPSGPPSGPPGSPAAGGDCPVGPQPTEMTGWNVSEQTPSIVPVVITRDLTCGSNRILLSLLNREGNRPVAAPDRPVSVAFYNLAADLETPTATIETEFIWAIENERGVYVANASFDQAGLWGMEIRTVGADGQPESIRVALSVLDQVSPVRVGQRAPDSDNPTLEDVDGDVARISTDSDPYLPFYETTVADALAAREPFAVVFATPKFCVSAQCGPTLDRLKPLALANSSITFINVEPYQLQDDAGQLQPLMNDQGHFIPVDAVIQWGLTSEPWLYVVDAAGIVRGSFELIFSEAEVQRVLDAVARSASEAG